MRVLATLGLAVRRLVQRPMRSFLLLQGTVWGVAVAVFPTAVVEGTRAAARMHGAELGADRVAIAPDPTAGGGEGLRREDLEAVRAAEAAAGVPVRALAGARVVALLEGGADDPRRPAALVGATPGVLVARGLEVAAGRPLAPDDPPDRCVVEDGVARWLGRPPLRPGDRLTLPGRAEVLEVVGVLAPRSAVGRRTNDLGFDVEHPFFARLGQQLLFALGIPWVEDAWKRADRVVWTPLEGDRLDWIFLRSDTEVVKRAAEVAREALVERGRAPVTLHPLVLPLVLGQEIDRFDAVQLALFLACLAMGAVVMANVGLLVVMRRRGEIAIRRVEGATRADIAAHFLLEGLVLTALGAAVGCVLGMALAALRVSLEPVTGFAWRFPWRQGLLAVGVALVLGTGASVLPALRAAGSSPIDGLVDE